MNLVRSDAIPYNDKKYKDRQENMQKTTNIEDILQETEEEDSNSRKRFMELNREWVSSDH